MIPYFIPNLAEFFNDIDWQEEVDSIHVEEVEVDIIQVKKDHVQLQWKMNQ